MKKKEEIICKKQIDHESEIFDTADLLSEQFSLSLAESIEIAIEMHELDILYRGLILGGGRDPVPLEAIAIAFGIKSTFRNFSKVKTHTYDWLDRSKLFKEAKAHLTKYDGKLTVAEALRIAMGIRKTKILSAGLSVIDETGQMPSGLEAIAIAAGYGEDFGYEAPFGPNAGKETH
jgi:hypothetical protein